ncbi:uncharacterized protein OCT59_016805 [Rhizophagus irregularis]|uniref:uncharacterized protein n=1 Tax=Rhizophagus irregularis TaxID=588596 RepID=UPI0033253604|nr:hypothetical protein OCT59_016805 [Rhizophagus irregularis]
MEKPSFVWPFGWASEVWKNQVSFGRSGGLLKYRNPKDSFGRSGGLPKIGCSEEWENSKIHSDVLPCSEERENSKIRSGVLPCSKERENSKIRSGGLLCSEEWENSKDSIWWASEERKTKKPRFVRSGGLLKNENLKIRSGGLLKNENPKIKIHKDSCGGLPTNENPKIKIRSGGFRLSKERKKLKIRLVSSEEWKKPRLNNGKPRFIWCLGWVLDKQKKTNDSFGGFLKDQDS